MTQVLGVQSGGLDVLAGERTDGVGGLPERERDAMRATWLVKLCLILGPLVAIWQFAATGQHSGSCDDNHHQISATPFARGDRVAIPSEGGRKVRR
jgi:hypothetical protein